MRKKAFLIKTSLIILIFSLLLTCKTIGTNKPAQNKKTAYYENNSQKKTSNGARVTSAKKKVKINPFPSIKLPKLKKYIPKISINTKSFDGFLKSSKEISADAHQGIKKISLLLKKNINGFFNKAAVFFKEQGRKFSNLDFVKWWNGLFNKKQQPPAAVAAPVKSSQIIKPAKTTIKPVKKK